MYQHVIERWQSMTLEITARHFMMATTLYVPPLLMLFGYYGIRVSGFLIVRVSLRHNNAHSRSGNRFTAVFFFLETDLYALGEVALLWDCPGLALPMLEIGVSVLPMDFALRNPELALEPGESGNCSPWC